MQRDAYDFCGIRPDESWNYTPAEIDLMLSVASEKRRMSEDFEYYQAYRAAYTCALLFNVHRDRQAHPKPLEPYDFMPEYPKPKPPERVVMTDEEIEATITNFVYPMLKATEGGNL